MNLWKGEFIMRKNVKIIVGVVVLILVLVVGSFVGLIINRTNDHKFGRYVSTEGPWGMTATWVSEDSASYLVCKKENDEPFANCSKVWNYLGRLHNDLSEKKDSRAHDLADHTHHTYDCVNLWQVAAVCSKLLPDIRNCIETHDVNTLVCQI